VDIETVAAAAGRSADDVHPAEVRAMVLVTGIALLALFSLVSILLGSEDGREAPGGGGQPDPARYVATWLVSGGRRA